MDVGEKIRFFRGIRGINQKTLSELAHISISSIGKYEQGIRIPKYEQVLKIADALRININDLIELDIRSIDEVIPYLFAISKVGGIKFHGKKGENGKYVNNAISISFNDSKLQSFIKAWAEKQEIIEQLRVDAKNNPDSKAREYLMNRANEIEQSIQLTCVADKV